jgi:hypothetical protein
VNPGSRLPPAREAGGSRTVSNYQNNQWQKAEMVYPNGSCQVSVGQINNVDTLAENWTDTWHPRASPRDRQDHGLPGIALRLISGFFGIREGGRRAGPALHAGRSRRSRRLCIRTDE